MPAATHGVQWGNADVWKVGGKVFAIIGWNDGNPAITFKTGEIGFEVLSNQPGLRPAPYMASRGLKWIQAFDSNSLSDDDLHAYVKTSYDMIARALTKARRAEIGLTRD
ncbi:MAG: MmcQ/YjbR family DNA-binding protein [Rhodobacteraceae bacterium]|nr:MmcQ/YjbR family DNA-binding protein [Paracoccaceae bacterium]